MGSASVWSALIQVHVASIFVHICLNICADLASTNLKAQPIELKFEGILNSLLINPKFVCL